MKKVFLLLVAMLIASSAASDDGILTGGLVLRNVIPKVMPAEPGQFVDCSLINENIARISECRAFVLHGSAIFAGRFDFSRQDRTTSEMERFRDTPVQQIRHRMESYIASTGGVLQNTPEKYYLIISLEYPLTIAEIDLLKGEYERDCFLEGTNKRLAVLREYIPESMAYIGLFSTFRPAPNGVETDAVRKQVKALQELSRAGFFDQFDFSMPMVYARFGPNDPQFGRNVHMTAQSMRLTPEAVTRSSGLPLPMLPLLSETIYNVNSVDDRQLNTPAGIRRQIAEIVKASQVNEVIGIGFFYPRNEAVEAFNREARATAMFKDLLQEGGDVQTAESKPAAAVASPSKTRSSLSKALGTLRKLW